MDEYPATARLLEAGAGAFVTNVDDKTADRAERALLELLGRTSVLAASAADHDLTWLLELYSDARTAPLEEGVVEAALLLRAAIPPRSARKGAALRERWAQQGADQLARRPPRGRAVGRCDGRRHRGGGAPRCAWRRRRCSGCAAEVEPCRPGRLRASRGARPHAPRPGRAGAALPARGPRGARLRREAGAGLHQHPRDGGRALGARLPVVVDGRPWGALSIQSTEPNAFDEGDASMLRSAAHQLSAGLRAAVLRERLERAQLGTAEALRAALDARAAATVGTPALACVALRGRRPLSGALGRGPERAALRRHAARHRRAGRRRRSSTSSVR